MGNRGKSDVAKRGAGAAAQPAMQKRSDAKNATAEKATEATSKKLAGNANADAPVKHALPVCARERPAADDATSTTSDTSEHEIAFVQPANVNVTADTDIPPDATTGDAAAADAEPTGDADAVADATRVQDGKQGNAHPIATGDADAVPDATLVQDGQQGNAHPVAEVTAPPPVQDGQQLIVHPVGDGTATVTPADGDAVVDAIDPKSNAHQYLPTKYVTDSFNLPADKGIPFLRKDSPLLPDAIYAVRSNEAFEDAGAAWANERTYVRPAWTRAREIHIIPTHDKNPIILLRGFEEKAIQEGAKPPSECAKHRTHFHDNVKLSQKKKKFRKEDDTIKEDPLYRITGPTKVIESIAKNATAKNYWSTNGHHVEGMSVAHGNLPDDFVQKIREAGALVMPYSDIVTSKHADRQLTIRAKGAIDPSVFYNFILKLQAADKSLDVPELAPCFATFRTYNCVRMTLNKPVDPNMLRIIRVKLPPNCVALTDVPLDVWAPSAGGDAERKTSKAPPQNQPRLETPEGKKMVRLAADFEPHPEEFAIVAEIIGASLVRIENNRYTVRSRACMGTFPQEADISELLEGPFVVEIGNRPVKGTWKCYLQGQAWV